MLRKIYTKLLRGPRFRGRHRLESALRAVLLPASDTVDGFKMELDPQEWLQIHLMAGELPEPGTTELFRRLLRSGDTYIDVGAHVGFHALAAAGCVGPLGKVIAIEPQPYNCEKVLTNTEINGFSNILVVTAAVGAEDGFVVLHNQKRNDKARLTLVGDGVSDLASCFEVPVARLDSIVERHRVGHINLLKIDVEGYEREVLAGAMETLSSTDNLVFECLPDTEGSMVRDIVQTLNDKGFVLRQINGDAWRPGSRLIENNIWASRV